MEISQKVRCVANKPVQSSTGERDSNTKALFKCSPPGACLILRELRGSFGNTVRSALTPHHHHMAVFGDGHFRGNRFGRRNRGLAYTALHIILEFLTVVKLMGQLAITACFLDCSFRQAL